MESIYMRDETIPATISRIKRNIQELNNVQFTGLDIYVPKENTVNNAIYDVHISGQDYINGAFFYVEHTADTQTMPNSKVYIAVSSTPDMLTPVNSNDIFLTSDFLPEDSSDQNGISKWLVNFYIVFGASISNAYAKVYVLSTDTGSVSLEFLPV